jgi:hypothetical protein
VSEPNRQIIGLPVERTVPPERDPGLVDPEIGSRVRSDDYGAGTVVAVAATGIQIHWDIPLLGTTGVHLLVHDKAYVARLERL